MPMAAAMALVATGAALAFWLIIRPAAAREAAHAARTAEKTA